MFFFIGRTNISSSVAMQTPQQKPVSQDEKAFPRIFTQGPVELAQGQQSKLTTAVTRNTANLKVNFCIVVRGGINGCSGAETGRDFYFCLTPSKDQKVPEH